MQEKILDNKRLQYIDIAKGIAMICIILGHMGNANINRVVFKIGRASCRERV